MSNVDKRDFLILITERSTELWAPVFEAAIKAHTAREKAGKGGGGRRMPLQSKDAGASVAAAADGMRKNADPLGLDSDDVEAGPALPPPRPKPRGPSRGGAAAQGSGGRSGKAPSGLAGKRPRPPKPQADMAAAPPATKIETPYVTSAEEDES